jgi:hypothetical protein
MPPRGSRLACTLRTVDGCIGAYSAYPGDAPKSISSVEPVKWDKEPQKDVLQGAFSVIGELGMTGQVMLVNQYQWRALKLSKLEEPFYAAILWGTNPQKVLEDAAFLAKRSGG